MSRWSPFALVACAALGSTASPARGGPTHETFPARRAEEALPDALRTHPAYRVRDVGTTEAFLTRWELESDFGLFVCPSNRMLEVRTQELRVLAGVVSASAGDEALKGLRHRLSAVPSVAVELIEDPIGTLESAAEGAKRTLGRVGHVFSRRRTTDYEDGGAEAVLTAAEKRRVASELGLDVYSTNPKVQELLRELARARRAGGLLVDLAKLAVPGGAGAALSGLSTTSDLTSLLRDRTPAELDDEADSKLERRGVGARLRRRFLSTRALSPRHRTVIADVVDRLAGVKNVEALVAAAAESRDEAQAFLHEDQALALGALHHGPDPILSLDAAGGVVAAFTRSGAMVVPIPIDVVAFVPEVEVAVASLLAMPGSERATTRTISHVGHVTPTARDYLHARRFQTILR